MFFGISLFIDSVCDKCLLFYRSEIDHLTALLQSKTVDSPVTGEEKRMELVTSEQVLSHELKAEYPNSSALQNGIENRLVSTPFVSSRV